MMVFGVSPFTRKPSRQPSPVGVVFRGKPRGAGWFCGEAVRATGREQRRGARSKKGPESGKLPLAIARKAREGKAAPTYAAETT